MATRSWAFRPLSPDSLLRDSAEWANVLNSFLNFTDEGLDISSNTGDIGTITVGVLQGAELTIDLNATGTDPVLLHDSFSLNADGSASFAGDLDAVNGTFGTITAGTLNGDAIDIYLGVGGGPGGVVISHQSFGLYTDGTAEFAGGIEIPWGYGIDFMSSLGPAMGSIGASGSLITMADDAGASVSVGTAIVDDTLETAVYIGASIIYVNNTDVRFAVGANDSYAAGYRTVTWYSPNV